MRKLLAVLFTLALAWGLAACAPARTIDAATWQQRISDRVLAVEGVSGGEVRVAETGPVQEPKIVCLLTSDATTHDELVAILEKVLRAVVAETRELDRAYVDCRVSHGEDTARMGELDAFPSIRLLRQRFA